jgi:hypothetical protein
MTRATRFRSFSPLSWPTKRYTKIASSSSHPKRRGTNGVLSLKIVFPYDDSAYESDLDVRIGGIHTA